MRIELAQKVAIVTGAGRGIGRQIALTFAREGMSVAATDIDPNGLVSLESEAASEGLKLATYVFDVRMEDQAARAIFEITARFGRIDVLVNNAGVSVGGTVEKQPVADWKYSVETNLTGTFVMCQAVIPAMKKQKWGRILNAASFAAIVPSVGSAAYAASKAGVASFTRVLAGEVGPWNITVNAYAPGMVPTQMNHFAEAPPAVQERLLNSLTLRRWGEKQDVANLLCFLASDLASYITGTLVDVSGGKFATQFPQTAYEQAGVSTE